MCEHLHPLLLKLAGGDRKSKGRIDEVAAEVLDDLALFAPVFAGICSADKIICIRAIHVIEQVSAQHPQLLQPYKHALLHEVSRRDLWEVRTQLCLLLPRLELTPRERTDAIALLRTYLDDKRSFIRTFAMQALADFTDIDPALKAEVIPIIEALTITGSAAMRARGRKLLQQFNKNP